MGVSLFVHSVRLVLGDWRNALKISGLLYLIYAIPALIFALLFPVPTRPEQGMAAIGNGGFLGLITAILAIIAFVWIAVAWHRYVLLDEMPTGQFPEFNSSRLLSYGGYSLLIGLIGVVLSLIVSTVVGIIAIPLLGVGGAFITGLLALACVLIVGYRLAPILPAVAIGKPLTLRQAWEATNNANAAIIVLAVLSAIAAIAIDIPAFILAAAGPLAFLGVLWTLATGWLKMIVGVSILTTLYGHYIEGRAIPSATARANT
jgi:hypothetical protein